MRLPQDSLSFPVPQSVISANLGSIAVDYVGLSWFSAAGERTAIGAVANFLYRPVGGYLPRGYMVGPAFRFYPGSRALWRFHYTAFIAWQSAWLTTHSDIASDGVTVGLGIGWQWFATPDLAVGFEFGSQYASQFSHRDHEALRQVFGIRPLLSLSLGYAW